MKFHNPYRLTFAIALSATLQLWPVAIAAEETPQSQEQIAKQLEALKTQIKKYQGVLDETKTERSGIEKDLKHNEKSIGELMQQVRKIQDELGNSEENIKSLKNEQRNLEDAKVDQQQLIIKQIRAAYEIGQQGTIKVLLNQEDPNLVSRMLHYYDYFNQARSEQINDYQKTIAALQEVELSIAQERVALKQHQLTLNGQRDELEVIRAARKRTLVALRATIKTRADELQKLRTDRERLEMLLDDINSEIIDIPTPFETVSFAQLRGRMSLPVAGNVVSTFAATAGLSQLHHNGLFIRASEGHAVHAIHYGRVVFSDWLRGFGLLLIINHGEGYMSLYGHNQSLLYETGDWVAADEVIAHVGNSGGMSEVGLYFEIRRNGRPQNPSNWCTARV